MSICNMMPKCDRCGRFHDSMKPGCSFAMRYSGYPPTPDHEVTRCVSCTEKFGALQASSGMADWTAGVIRSPQVTEDARHD